MEYFELNLETVIGKTADIPTLDYSRQLLLKLHTLMTNGIMHRDIKPDNILVKGGELVLSDYGTSRYMSYIPSYMTGRIFAITYSPPEVSFGEQNYSYATDVWVLGLCLMEIFSRSLIVVEPDITKQIQYITDLIGEPSIQDIGKYYPKYVSIGKVKKTHLSLKELMLLGKITPDQYSLLIHMVVWNPEKRWSPFELLNHPLFSEVYGKFRFETSPVKYIPRVNSMYAGSIISSMISMDTSLIRINKLSPEERLVALSALLSKVGKVKTETIHLAIYLFDALMSLVTVSDLKVLAMACLQLATYEYEVGTTTNVSEYDFRAIRSYMLFVMDYLGTTHYPSYITMYRLYYTFPQNRDLHRQYMIIALVYGLNTKYTVFEVISNIIAGKSSTNPDIYRDLADAVNWYNKLEAKFPVS
jgi:hypothetical protein